MSKSDLFRVVLIPAGVFVSVMFGGGASTGLEIVAYMSSNGPIGGFVAIGLIAIGYVVLVFMCFELARLYRVYDYRSFAQIILGSRAWIIYEVFITLALFGVIAYSTTGGATALADFLGAPRYIVTALILIVVVYLTYQGRRLVELTMVGTTLLLIASTSILVIGTIATNGDEIARQLQDATIDVSSLFNRVGIYMVAVGAFVPVLLFASTELRTRGEVVMASIASAIAICLPPVGMHLAYLARFPEILDQAVPNYWIAGEVMPTWFVALFVIVLNLVILQTVVGVMQGIIERLDSWSRSAVNRRLSARQHAVISIAIMLACLSLSGFGVQKLLGWAFDLWSWIFLFTMIIPLFVVGSYRIWVRRNERVTA